MAKFSALISYSFNEKVSDIEADSEYEAAEILADHIKNGKYKDLNNIEDFEFQIVPEENEDRLDECSKESIATAVDRELLRMKIMSNRDGKINEDEDENSEYENEDEEEDYDEDDEDDEEDYDNDNDYIEEAITTVINHYIDQNNISPDNPVTFNDLINVFNVVFRNIVIRD